MQCPGCQVDLQVAERHFVEIDYCPKCRGVWLDRGELDKIIERAAANDPPRAAPRPSAVQPAPRWRDDDDDHRDPRHQKSRKRGFLGELFDFD
jgi:Zn-finger nucleic acid-binding protein